MEKSGDDCYFYYYSTCTKGDECPYRHCESALGSEITCSHWREGKCMRPSVCKYRHMESRINRSSIQCWFETQPTGCRKPHCVFAHKKPRNLATDEELKTNEGVILPVVTNANNSDISIDNNCANNTNTSNCVNNSNVKAREEVPQIKLFDDSDYLNQSLQSFNENTTHNNNIEPISISINDCDEESDNENELSISNSYSINNNKTNSVLETNDYYNSYDNNSSKNYGIKTLEQIRMEKVFSHESDDCIHDNNSSDNFIKNDNKIQKPINKDLRVKIKRRSTADNELKPSVSNFNDNILDDLQQNDSLPDFGIKSLAQIRREREDTANKKQTVESDCQQSLSPEENQETKGEKRVASDSLSGVVKIRRTGPKITSSLKTEQNFSEREKPNEKISSSCEVKVTSTNFELNDLSAVSSSDSTNKQRLQSVDTDLDDFDFLDGDSGHNIDTNAIDDDDEDELMREINQVINS